MWECLGWVLRLLRGETSVLGSYMGSDLSELLSAFEIVEGVGCLAPSVDYCGVIAVTKQVTDSLEREVSILAE